MTKHTHDVLKAKKQKSKNKQAKQQNRKKEKSVLQQRCFSPMATTYQHSSNGTSFLVDAWFSKCSSFFHFSQFLFRSFFTNFFDLWGRRKQLVRQQQNNRTTEQQQQNRAQNTRTEFLFLYFCNAKWCGCQSNFFFNLAHRLPPINPVTASLIHRNTNGTPRRAPQIWR